MKRYLDSQIRQYLQKKMVMLTGPRRVGKKNISQQLLSEFDGGQYLNFDVPKTEDKLAMRVSALEVDVMQLKNSLARSGSTVQVAPTGGTMYAAARSVSGPDDFGQIVVDDTPDF